MDNESVKSEIAKAVPAAGITLVLGVTKEVVYDWRLGKGTPEWGDMIADVIGVAVAVIVGGA